MMKRVIMVKMRSESISSYMAESTIHFFINLPAKRAAYFIHIKSAFISRMSSKIELPIGKLIYCQLITEPSLINFTMPLDQGVEFLKYN